MYEQNIDARQLQPDVLSLIVYNQELSIDSYKENLNDVLLSKMTINLPEKVEPLIHNITYLTARFF